MAGRRASFFRKRRLSPAAARWLLICGLLWLVVTVPIMSVNNTGEVYVASVEGVINPLSAAYLTRAIQEAERQNARAIVLQLNTPGGLESSMREMTQDILGSRIPVIVYVAPPGARAASAGMFITISGHIAAMAPGTNIGAAHPVALGGEPQEEVMISKVVQDAAALARSLAALRNRNAEWAEMAVRESASATEREALELNVIDLVAPTIEDLLKAVDGQVVETTVGEITLQVADARQVDIPMTIFERLLHVITDPNIAYLLLSLGAIGVIAELYNPGTFIPGIVGVISLALAFVALGALPLGWAGLGLMVLAVALMIGELETQGFGALGVGAIVAFVLGSLLLFVPLQPVSPALPAVRVSPWVILLMTITLVLFFGLAMAKIVQARRRPVLTGMESLIGQRGRVTKRLDPMGTVVVGGEEWSAQSETGNIEPGQEVEIVDVSGIVLRVEPV